MRACVSGSSGFVGSHMCAELKSRGYDVDGVDIRPGEHTNIVEDLVDVLRTDRMYAGNRAHYDLFVHCAYHVGGRAMIDGVPDVLSANVELDAALFRWALETRPGRILYFSSSAVYPVHLQTAYCPIGIEDSVRRLHEDSTRLHGDYIGIPDSRYGWAKLNGEMLVKAARESGLAVTVVRPASGCGATQSLDYPWTSIISRAVRGDMTLWGNPDQVRDFIDISDVVKGALSVAESGTTEPVNLATGIPTSLRQLSAIAFEISHPGEIAPEAISVPGPEGVFYRVLSTSRLHKYYVPIKTIEEMVRETIAALGS